MPNRDKTVIVDQNRSKTISVNGGFGSWVPQTHLRQRGWTGIPILVNETSCQMPPRSKRMESPLENDRSLSLLIVFRHQWVMCRWSCHCQKVIRRSLFVPGILRRLVKSLKKSRFNSGGLHIYPRIWNNNQSGYRNFPTTHVSFKIEYCDQLEAFLRSLSIGCYACSACDGIRSGSRSNHLQLVTRKKVGFRAIPPMIAIDAQPEAMAMRAFSNIQRVVDRWAKV